MIRVCDKTLAVLDFCQADRASLLRFLELLIETGVDGIELSEKMYARLSPLCQYPGYSLQVGNPAAVPGYHNIAEFVCRCDKGGASPGIQHVARMEIGFDELRWPDKAVGYGDCSKIRITGLDDGMNGDYPALFKSLKSQFSGDLQFCPGNRLYAATALATEWAIQETDTRDSSVVTAFGGIGGLAATEEVIMALRLAGLRKADKEYPFFPEMAGLLERISQAPVRQDKAVIGKRIFTVESGIHVDGILKHPDCYEPFAPGIVGGKRQITLGKQSGRASVGAKLAELGIGCNNEQILQILTKVKQAGYQKNGSVTESEFAGIVRDCLASGQRQAERL